MVNLWITRLDRGLVFADNESVVIVEQDTIKRHALNARNRLLFLLLDFNCFQKSIQKLIFVSEILERGGSATAVDGHPARYTKSHSRGVGIKYGFNSKDLGRGVICRTIKLDKIK